MASGPSWLASSVQTRKTAVPVAARQFPTTLPLLTGSFTTASASLWTRSIQMYLLAAEDYSDLIGGVENVTSYADRIVSTINPAISMDGSYAENAPLPQTKPHVCNKPYSEVEDIKMDLIELHSVLSSLLPEEEERCSRVSFWISKASAARHYNRHGRQHTNTADTAQRLPPQQLQSCVAFGMACQCGHAVHRVTKQGPQLHCQVCHQV